MKNAHIPDDVKAAAVRRLGKEPDNAIATDLKISREWVGQQRRARNIPPYKHEFGRDSKVSVTTIMTKSDERQTRAAMKKTGHKKRSGYVRTAVREKNKEVLG